MSFFDANDKKALNNMKSENNKVHNEDIIWERSIREAMSYALDCFISAVPELPTLVDGIKSKEIRISLGKNYYASTLGYIVCSEEKNSFFSGKKTWIYKKVPSEQYRADVVREIADVYISRSSSFGRTNPLFIYAYLSLNGSRGGDGSYYMYNSPKSKSEIETSIKQYLLKAIKNNGVVINF